MKSGSNEFRTRETKHCAYFWVGLPVWGVLVCLLGCVHRPRIATELPRLGDEIIVAGRMFHTSTRVVTWLDPSGYDAYRVERRFSPLELSGWDDSKIAQRELTTPNRFGLRKDGLTPFQLEQVRGGGWDLDLLREKVDQFVLHFDASGTSRQCFKVMHDQRCLSVHFLLDLDGTIYQTLDLKERAWHATSSNSRSIGIEIANIGAHPPGRNEVFDGWYRRDAKGLSYIKVPDRIGDPGFLVSNFVPRPSRNEPVHGEIQGCSLLQYDFTEEQYEALGKLTAALCKIFPKLKCDFPKDESGKVLPRQLPPDVLNNFSGILGHYHIQSNKVDPGPAMQWNRIIADVQKHLSSPFSSKPTKRNGP